MGGTAASSITIRVGVPGRIEAVKSGAESFFRSSSTITSLAIWRRLAARPCKRSRRACISPMRPSSPVARAWSARAAHCFFFGPADREFAIKTYGFARDRTSVIGFGVDTEFWRPMQDVAVEDFVVAVGQDLNRDY